MLAGRQPVPVCRYSDVSSLTWGNIQHTSLGQEIVIDSMQKTKHSVRVPLSDIALSWLPERGNNAASQKVFVGLTSLCQTNLLLKKMAKSVGITKTLVFTYLDIYLRRVQSLLVVTCTVSASCLVTRIFRPRKSMPM